MSSSISITKKWIAEFVIFHSLCPFAKLPFETDNILYKEESSAASEQIIMSLHEIVLTLDSYSNAFLILPKMDFTAYLDIFYASETYLEQTEFSKDFQLASFHPNYQFDGYEKQDKRNKTNQSPFPMIHVLRTKEMADAVKKFGDTTRIFKSNEQKMKNLD